MAEELKGQIEAAEEAGGTAAVLDLVATCTSHGGEEDWAEVAESRLDSFFRLVKGGSAVADASNGFLVIFASLAAWKEHEAIVEVALGCIVSLANTKTTTTKAVGDLDLSLLLTMLQSFPDESTIQEQACLAIEGLAMASETYKTALGATDGIQDELVAAKERITNERNKAYPGRAAQALGLALE
jgi:hypothetical protein